MAGEIEVLAGLERKLTLALPWSAIKSNVAAKMQDTRRRVRVNGFRPGKAPLAMIESMYGKKIHNEVLNDAAVKAFYDTVTAEKLAVAGLRRFEPLPADDDKETVKIAAVFEVFPDSVAVGDLAEKEMNKIVTEITEPDVDKTLEILRKQRAVYEEVNRAAGNTDQVTLDFAGKVDGVAFTGGSSENFTFILGAGKMLPEFETGVIGMKAGESKEITVPFPENYPGKELAGKEAVFKLHLKSAAAAVLPEINAEFAQSLGVKDGNLTTMRREIKENLSREVARRVELINKEAVINLLLTAADFPVPTIMIEREIRRLKEKAEANQPQGQGSTTKAAALPDELFREQATKSVKVGLIINQLVDTEALTATPEQIKAVIDDIAQNYENPEEVSRYYLHNKEEYQNVQSLATEKNIVDFVLQKIKIKEVKKSFTELMQA